MTFVTWINIIDIDLSTTPTTQIIIQKKKANGGIILTASHNPKNWNALKLFNSRGEFLVKDEAEEIFKIVKKNQFEFVRERKHIGANIKFKEEK